MVVSQLNEDINYPNIKNVDKADVNVDAAVYEMSMYDVNIFIALGNVKYTFVTKGVLYVPIYMVHGDKVVSQIGVFEFLNRTFASLTDDDGDIDLNKVDPPLLYSFATKEYILSFLPTTTFSIEEDDVIVVDDDDDDDDEDDDDEDEDDDEGDDEEGEERELEVEELVETVEDEKDSLPKSDWVQKFLNNSRYNIIDNEAGGDCLFAAIRDAFEFTGSHHSVAEQRKLIAEEVTQDTLDNYTTIYNDLLKEKAKDQKMMKKIKKKFNALKKLHHKHRADKIKAKEYADEGAKLNKQYYQLKKERGRAEDMIEDEFTMMKGLKTLVDFKKFVQTCKFWGDMWAISTLERILNIKLIILSSEKYHEDDMVNVLQCGQLSDNILQKDGTFRPQYYIILDFMGNHYKLITYKGKRIFTFKELPYGLVKAITEICMSGDGAFDKIPEFNKFKSGNEPLFDENIVFQFYSRSQNKLPGKGAGEKISPEAKDKFTELRNIKNWRKVLSNFYIEPFTSDGLTWNSAEHLYHALKFKKGHPEFYKQFSLESDSAFSKEPLLAKAAGGKTGIATEKGTKKKIRLRPKEITADEDFWPQKNEKMEEALRAKFTQGELPKKVLKATGNAKLSHYLGRGKGSEVWEHLMRVRKEI